jgi:hypothetical protein
VHEYGPRLLSITSSITSQSPLAGSDMVGDVVKTLLDWDLCSYVLRTMGSITACMAQVRVELGYFGCSIGEHQPGVTQARCVYAIT